MTNSLLSIEFLQNKIKYYYKIEFNKNTIVREQLDIYNPRKSNIFKRKTNLNNRLYLEIFCMQLTLSFSDTLPLFFAPYRRVCSSK